MSPTAKKNTSDLQSVKMWRFPNSSFSQKTIHTRWASTTSKWSYDPYESGVVTLLFGLITPLTTSIQAHLLGPSVSTHVIPVFLSCFVFIFVDFSGFPENSPGFVSSIKNMIQQKNVLKKVAQVWIWMPSQVHWVVLCSAWCGSPKSMGLSVGMVGNIKKYGEEMPKDDVLEKKVVPLQICRFCSAAHVYIDTQPFAMWRAMAITP